MSLSILILCQNGAKTLDQALVSAQFANEIILLDDNSTDDSVNIAFRHHAVVKTATGVDFASKRSELLRLAKSEWVFYLDADEIITPELKSEIETIVKGNVVGSYKVNRINFFLGTKMYTDSVDRLFHNSVISGWVGVVHESPVLNQVSMVLKNSLLHYTHQDITSMLTKTNHWSEYEAELRLSANHPPISWWRLVRIFLTFFFNQFFGHRLYQYGRSGLFESYFQAIDKLIVYTKLWEKQLIGNS